MRPDRFTWGTLGFCLGAVVNNGNEWAAIPIMVVMLLVYKTETRASK